MCKQQVFWHHQIRQPTSQFKYKNEQSKKMAYPQAARGLNLHDGNENGGDDGGAHEYIVPF